MLYTTPRYDRFENVPQEAFESLGDLYETEDKATTYGVLSGTGGPMMLALTILGAKKACWLYFNKHTHSYPENVEPPLEDVLTETEIPYESDVTVGPVPEDLKERGWYDGHTHQISIQYFATNEPDDLEWFTTNALGEDDLTGVSELRIGDVLGYPEEAISAFESNAGDDAAVQHLRFLRQNSEEFDRSFIRYIGLVPYVPKSTISSIRHAATTGYAYENALQRLDSMYGNTALTKHLDICLSQEAERFDDLVAGEYDDHISE